MDAFGHVYRENFFPISFSYEFVIGYNNGEFSAATGIFMILERFFSLFRTYNLADLDNFYGNSSAVSQNDKRRKLCTIAVIDDQMFTHLENLRDAGFNIAHVGNVSNVINILEYDVIACDLRGVGTVLNERLQGASVIQEIRRIRPDKYLIAYSGSFDRSKITKIASECADTLINKSADTDKWTQELDKAISITLNPIERWKRIRSSLVEMNISSQNIASIEQSYCRAIITGNKNILLKSINKTIIGEDARAILNGLLSAAIWSFVGL